MIKINDVVSVGQKGICKVENITKNAYVGCDENKEYYVLKPVASPNNMVVYFPVDTKMNIRKLATKTEVDRLLSQLDNLEVLSVNAEEERLKVYSSIIQKGSFEDYFKLVKTILLRKNKISKKQFNFQEQKMLDTALSCVLGECEIVLGKNKESLKEEISKSLKLSIEF